MAKLTDPVTILKGVGPSKAKLLANLNIFTLEDLICHFPRGYEDRTRLVTIASLEVAEFADSHHEFRLVVYLSHKIREEERFAVFEKCRICFGEYYGISVGSLCHPLL